MTTFAMPTTASRPRRPTALRAIPDPVKSRIEIVENPLVQHDKGLAEAAEDAVREALRGESLGEVQVRFRQCRDEEDGVRFICKVENPPRVDTDAALPWRWWSPILATADELRDSLDEGLRVRRQRLALAPRA